MSLRRRIGLAAALAAAAVAAAVALTGYLATRTHLRGEVDAQLLERATGYTQQYNHIDDGHGDPFAAGQPPAGAYVPPLFGNGGGPSGATDDSPGAPPNQRFGGAPGYFQVVYSNATVEAADGGTPQLPVDAQVRQIARTGSGRFYSDATVKGVHLRVLTIGDKVGHDAVQVGLPLTDDDNVLHGLILSYGLIVGGGVLLALLLGGLIGRNALRPIIAFTRRTEAVTETVDVSQRIEEAGGARELARLASSFNRTLDALERSVQAQRHLVADASHELRTPLAALRSNIQIFLEAERLPLEERVGLQSAIVAELDELTQLVSDVVELARGAAPGERVESVELDQIVREAVERVRRRAPDMKLQVSLQPTEIHNNSERVARAATNLLDNARKWSPPDGTIEVTLADGLLTVRDHGPGFAERDLAHVFDRFYRADKARSMPGSGLGLAIVRQAAEQHGGTVQAGNARDGGAVLKVRFGSADLPPAAIVRELTAASAT